MVASAAMVWCALLPAPSLAGQEGDDRIENGAPGSAPGGNEADIQAQAEAAAQPVPLAAPEEEEPVVPPAALDAYARARLAEIDRALPEATAAYGEAAKIDPASVAVARRGYRQAVLAGDKPLALLTAHNLDKAGQLSRDGSVLLLADMLDRRQWQAAAVRIDRLEAEGNLAFLAPLMRGWLSLAQGRFVPPVQPGEESPAAFGNRYRAEQLLLLAVARGDREGLDEAYANAVAAVDGFDTEERAVLAVRLAKLGRRDLALRLLAQEGPAGTDADADAEAEAALKRASKLYRKRQITPNYGLAVLMNRLAGDLRSQGEGVATLSIARMAGFADPANDDIRVTIARAALSAEYPEIAYAEAGKVQPASPVWFDAATMQLRAMIDQDHGAEAIARGQQLVERDHGSARSWRLLGDLFAQQGRFTEAASAYQQSRQAMGGREDAALLLQLGGALEQAGQWPEARPLLERVVELAPDSAVALNHLGYALADRGEDLPRAIAMLEKANRIRPKEPAYIDSLGWAYFRAGNYAKALPLIQSAVENEPGNAELNEHLGDVLWAAGRRFEARYAWRAALVGAEDADEGVAQIRARLNDKLDGKGLESVRP